MWAVKLTPRTNSCIQKYLQSSSTVHTIPTSSKLNAWKGRQIALFRGTFSLKVRSIIKDPSYLSFVHNRLTNDPNAWGNNFTYDLKLRLPSKHRGEGRFDHEIPSSNSEITPSTQKLGRDWSIEFPGPAKTLLAFLALLVSIMLYLFGRTIENPNYNIFQRTGIAIDLMKRFLRASYTGFSILIDYKITWIRFPEGHLEHEKQTHKVHERSAQKLLDLFVANSGVYIKAGQYIASLKHILPDEYTGTMSILQDKAPFVDYRDIERFFVSELGQRPDEIFQFFNPVPLAAASLAQVHHAITKEGDEVAVKVQYPQVADRFNCDMWTHDVTLDIIAKVFKDWKFAWMGPEIRDNLSKELDFVCEQKNAEAAEKFIKQYMHNVHIPKVLPKYSTKRILTMEYIGNAVKINDVEGMKKLHINPAEAARTMIELFSRQLFVAGFLHADPHRMSQSFEFLIDLAGNILVRKGHKGQTELVLLDHGLYRHLPEEFRSKFCEMYRALVLKDERTVKRISREFGVQNHEIFAVLLLMRTFKTGSTGMGSKMTSKEFANLVASLRTQIKEFAEVMRTMPRELLLVLRNLNLVRSINRDLGAPVNRFTIMARIASEGLYQPRNLYQLSFFHRMAKTLQSKLSGLMFAFNLWWFSFQSWLAEVYMKRVLLEEARAGKAYLKTELKKLEAELDEEFEVAA